MILVKFSGSKIGPLLVYIIGYITGYIIGYIIISLRHWFSSLLPSLDMNS